MGKYGFAFPSDLKCFLRAGVPTTFYNYHKFAEESLVVGSDEDLLTQAIKNNAAQVNENPLIPLCGNQASSRFMPSKLSGRSLPVVSFAGIDDPCQYGDNLFEF